MSDEERAAAFLRARLGGDPPLLAVVLGSGLGGVASTLEGAASVAASAVPGFRVSRVPGHEGAVHIGSWGPCRTLVFQGRVHLYEGHSSEAVTLPVRTASVLGARFLVLTNAAGALTRELAPGSLMRARELLDLFFRRWPWEAGTRGRPRPVPDPALGRIIDRAARAEAIPLPAGILSGSMGPAYETAAEVRWLQRLGVQAVCMSTIPEAIAAAQVGMSVGVVSLISNYATGLARAALDHAEVVERARETGVDLGRLLRATARLLAAEQ